MFDILHCRQLEERRLTSSTSTDKQALAMRLSEAQQLVTEVAAVNRSVYTFLFARYLRCRRKWSS